MIEITTWMDGFLKVLNDNFENRVWFVGLQGSYGRGEATETSDIDIVVIFDELSASDIQKYNTMFDSLPHLTILIVISSKIIALCLQTLTCISAEQSLQIPKHLLSIQPHIKFGQRLPERAT